MKETKDLIFHDGKLNRNTSAETLRESIKNTLQGSDDDNLCYMFNKAIKDLDKLKKSPRILVTLVVS